MKYLLVIICVVMVFMNCDLVEKITKSDGPLSYQPPPKYTMDDLRELVPCCPLCGSENISCSPMKESYGLFRCLECTHCWYAKDRELVEKMLDDILWAYGIYQPFEFKYIPPDTIVVN